MYSHIYVNYINPVVDLGIDTMGRLDIVIPDKLERELRIEIINRFGGKKGDMSKAVSEAIEHWIRLPTADDFKRIAWEYEKLKPEDREKLLKALQKLS
jgi:hypothetical protein